jgi:predicted aspartyl protease
MKPISIFFMILAAFLLGYYTSEYRHGNQIVAEHVIDAGTNALTSAAENAPIIVSIPTPVIISPGVQSVPAAAPTGLDAINQLIAAGKHAEAASLLNELLQKNPQNAGALWLLARVYEQQGRHKESVVSWFRYINAEIDAQKIENALAYLAKYLIRLTSSPSIFGESREWLMEQLNDLIKLTPANGELHLQLAKMYLHDGDREQAQYHALMAANQSETQTRAEVVLAKLTESEAIADIRVDEIDIKLQRFGKQFLVPVTIENESAKLLLDTGASISGLTSSYINRHYGLVKNSKPIQLNTASGSVDTYLFVVDTFTLDTFTLNKHMLAHLPMDNMNHFDGLLGVDILGRFEFVLDQDNALLKLRKRR